jgi:glycosyltransferase involved in cell wall biosynthesis
MISQQEKLKFSFKPDAPKVAIVITHFNYADQIEQALQSVLSQTYEGLTCVVVDDHSSPEHLHTLHSLQERHSSVRFIYKKENTGQISSFYTGVEAEEADFYCLLDPDDRYADTFVEELVNIHLCPYIYVPMVCSEQMFIKENRQLTGITKWYNQVKLNGELNLNRDFTPHLNFFPPMGHRWPWTSTSSMMFRSSLIQLLRPTNKILYTGQADSYLATGARYLGGSLIYSKPLVWRGLHSKNAYRTKQVFSFNESGSRQDYKENVKEVMMDAVINLLLNGGMHFFSKKHFMTLICNDFDEFEILAMKKKSLSVDNMFTRSKLMKLYFKRYIKKKKKH